MTPKKIIAETDRCVKCGYCIPHCPTYALSGDEAESPRGRIALIQALAEGRLEGTLLQDHLDHCLACRACESACPSGVRYSRLIAAARELGHQTRPSKARSLLLTLLSDLPYRSWPTRTLRLYRQIGPQQILRTLGGLRFRRLDDLLPETAPATNWQSSYVPDGETVTRVALFTGCVGRITDQPALLAAIKLLNHLGVEVLVPSEQRCCGAMHHYEGETAKARKLAAINQQAFAGIKADAVITVASGCGAHLAEYGQLGKALSVPVQDISSYLLQLPQLDALQPRPLKKRVAIHTPCSLKNIGGGEAPFQLLDKIPQLELLPLPENGLCCGGAGLQLISQPQTASDLREDKLQALKACKANILVTSNTGCALHLGAGVREQGLAVEILHPVELLARQL